MTAVTLSRAKSLHDALRAYLADGEGHNGHAERNLVTMGHGVSLLSPAGSMARTLGQVRRRDAIEAIHVIRSAAPDEVDPDDVDAVEVFVRETMTMCRRAFPGRQVFLAAQRDGVSGCLHVHAMVCARAFEDAEWTHVVARHPSKGVTEHVAVTETVERGSGMPAAMRDIFRVRHVSDEVIMEVRGFDNDEIVRTHGEGERHTVADLEHAVAKDYDWRTDLKKRISAARDASASIDEFVAKMHAARVDVRVRGKAGNLSYSFTDADDKHRTQRASGARGLGNAFGRKAADAAFKAERDRREREEHEQREAAAQKAIAARRAEQDDLMAKIIAEQEAALAAGPSDAEILGREEQPVVPASEPTAGPVPEPHPDTPAPEEAVGTDKSSPAARATTTGRSTSRERLRGYARRQRGLATRRAAEKARERQEIEEREDPARQDAEEPDDIVLRNEDVGVPVVPDFNRVEGLGTA